jgi:hypothetical protein
MATYIEKAMFVQNPLRVSADVGLGKGLISPVRSVSGSDTYATMRRLQPGDAVLHLTENRAIVGHSLVAESAREVQRYNDRWYVVSLSDYRPLSPPLDRAAIFGPYSGDLLEIANARTHALFYNSKLKLMQGAYITEVPSDLLTVLDRAYRHVAGKSLRALLRPSASSYAGR